MDHSIELWADLSTCTFRDGSVDGGCSPFPECLTSLFDTEDAAPGFWVSEWDLLGL